MWTQKIIRLIKQPVLWDLRKSFSSNQSKHVVISCYNLCWSQESRQIFMTRMWICYTAIDNYFKSIKHFLLLSTANFNGYYLTSVIRRRNHIQLADIVCISDFVVIYSSSSIWCYIKWFLFNSFYLLVSIENSSNWILFIHL